VNSISVPTNAAEMSPEELGQLVGSDREADYVLIDVHQPEEYRSGLAQQEKQHAASLLRRIGMYATTSQ